jgi:hypothetical protein
MHEYIDRESAWLFRDIAPEDIQVLLHKKVETKKGPAKDKKPEVSYAIQVCVYVCVFLCEYISRQIPKKDKLLSIGVHKSGLA